MLKDEALAKSLEARGKALTEQFSKLKDELRQLNDQEAQVAGLQRRVAMLETKYRGYLESLEQSRVDDALKFEGITNVSIVQPPDARGS